MSAGTIRVGIGGWDYDPWKETFYPPKLAKTKQLEHASRQLTAIEINATYYRTQTPECFERWAKTVPDGFRFAVKASRFCTTRRILAEGEQSVRLFCGQGLTALGDRLGPILYQLPPRFRINLERLESFLKLLPMDATHVFEFREKSWYVPETYELLDRYGASFCVHDMPGSTSERLAAGPIAYVRFHGGEGKYWGRYSDEGLLSWTDWMVAQAKAGRPVWAYFNNDIHAHAIHDAQTLKAMVAQAVR